MISYVFRRRTATAFSIEKLFDLLCLRVNDAGEAVRRLELPHVSTGVVSVVRNAWFVACQRDKGVLHITGDVHYAALLCPFSKVVVTIHDCVVLQRGTGLKRLVFWVLWFWLPLRLASVVTVISEQTRREVLETVKIPDWKIAVIPNFVDPAFDFDDRPFASEQPRILHVGTTANKNLMRVISALRGIRCVLVIVGPLTTELLRMLAQSDVQYENHVGIDHASMVRQYREADIVSFPSTYEGFGMPILEGQAVGRAVLTSDLEPMRSVAGEGALLVNPESADEIRAGFLSLMGDPLLRTRFVVAGRENCRRFSLDAVVARYRSLYREVAGR
jgi:glycosyltransferase involved in cell wall biosynthesis